MGISEPLADQPAHSIYLILNLDVPHPMLDDPLESQPSTRAPPIVQDEHQETQAAEVLGAHIDRRSPAIGYELDMRTAIDVNNGRIRASSEAGRRAIDKPV